MSVKKIKVNYLIIGSPGHGRPVKTVDGHINYVGRPLCVAYATEHLTADGFIVDRSQLDAVVFESDAIGITEELTHDFVYFLISEAVNIIEKQTVK